MRTIVCILFALTFLACRNDNKVNDVLQESQDKEAEYRYDQLPDSLRPCIQFANDKHDFGCFSNSQPKKVIFTYTNTGKAPLILHNVHGYCGCVSAEYSKTPVMPGQKGHITVIYDGRSYQKGKFIKEIIVNSNSVQRYYNLVIQGETI